MRPIPPSPPSFSSVKLFMCLGKWAPIRVHYLCSSCDINLGLRCSQVSALVESRGLKGGPSLSRKYIFRLCIARAEVWKANACRKQRPNLVRQYNYARAYVNSIHHANIIFICVTCAYAYCWWFNYCGFREPSYVLRKCGSHSDDSLSACLYVCNSWSGQLCGWITPPGGSSWRKR